MSLYQSYRPNTFTDVVGQDFVKKVLMNSCKTHTFHHGYIFFGFHGIGKTTLARIFAQGINCTQITAEGNPCHICENCLAYDTGRMIDVIEIDAASYTGVDNIREVIDHAKFTPTQGSYKIYIIDEVHMLSKGAFNALLKTLEEPPAHAIFLLATTEIQKIPDTILSRVIRFDLTKIGESDMRGLLESICKKEQIHHAPEALSTIIHRSRGSLRDALTMLEKCIIDKTLTEDNVQNALHLVNTAFLRKTFEAARYGKRADIEMVIQTLDNESTDIRQFAAQMTGWIINNINEGFEQKAFPIYRDIFDLFTQIFVQSKQVAVPMDILRMALYERIQEETLSLASKKTISTSDAASLKKDEKITPEENNTFSSSIKNKLPFPSKELPDSIHLLRGESGELPAPTNILNTPSNILPESTHMESISGHDSVAIDPSMGENIHENFLKKIQELGIKTTLLPLLRTASIEQKDGVLTIMTTSFGKGRCEDPTTHNTLLQAAQSIGNTQISILTPEDLAAQSANMARSIFD